MQVVPLAYSQVNWTDYIAISKVVVGHSPTASLDAAHIPPGDPFSFIASLEELMQKNSQPRKAVLNATHSLQHSYCSFLIRAGDGDLQYLGNLPLIRSSTIEGYTARGNPDSLVVLSGTLLEWKSGLPLLLASKEATNETYTQREAFSQIYSWFKKMNLRELFDGYNEVPTSDGFFRLERK